MNYRRISLYAGPGAGKSTGSSMIYSLLKQKGYNVELAREFVKLWAYQNRPVKEFDQVTIAGNQMDEEFKYLSNGVEVIVTDSPVYLSAIYAEYYFPQLDIHSHIESIADRYEERYPSINIFLDRADKKYKKEGRYQTYEQALEMDSIMLNLLKIKKESGIIDNFEIVKYNEYQKMIDIVEGFKNK